jgi:SAM-dependent methyltransferase
MIATEYCLPKDYQENPPCRYVGTKEKSHVWQAEVYRAAGMFAKGRTVLDLGCGLQEKAKEFLIPVAHYYIGVDMEEAENCIGHDLSNDEPRKFYSNPFEFIVCADVIEHVEKPEVLFENIHLNADGNTIIMFSTPSRDCLGAGDSGPPANEYHVREWSSWEFSRLLAHNGFEITNYPLVVPGRNPNDSPSCQMAICKVVL